MKLPTPDPIALQSSQALKEIVINHIKKAPEEWISFAEFMNLALYQPQYGYYSAGTYKLGQGGDFTTAPELSPLFGECIASQIQHAGLTHILELGAGTGKLALSIIHYLVQQNAFDSYAILEISADLQDRQKTLLKQELSPEIFQKVRWLSSLEEIQNFNGAIVMNEVFDALPVHLVEWHDNRFIELGVTFDTHSQNFCYAVQTESNLKSQNSALFTHADYIKNTYQVPDTLYVSEINLNAQYLLNALADCLESGIILAVDYGFCGKEYYHPERSTGTLMCHYQHLTNANPFEYIGLQDITAHVDFSFLAESAYQKGLNCLGYTTQANFLMGCQITERLLSQYNQIDKAYYQQAHALQKLLSPAEMGELFKVIAWSKNLSCRLNGFSSRGDLIYQL